MAKNKKESVSAEERNMKDAVKLRLFFWWFGDFIG